MLQTISYVFYIKDQTTIFFSTFIIACIMKERRSFGGKIFLPFFLHAFFWKRLKMFSYAQLYRCSTHHKCILKHGFVSAHWKLVRMKKIVFNSNVHKKKSYRLHKKKIIITTTVEEFPKFSLVSIVEKSHWIRCCHSMSPK